MQNQLSKLVGTIMDELKEISKTESIVGEPVRLGDKMVVPVTRLSLGFVVGGGEGQTPNKGSNLGGAGGGGAKIDRWVLSLSRKITYRFCRPKRVNSKV